MLAWTSCASSPPAARSSSAWRLLTAAAVAYWVAYSTPVFAVERIDVRGAPPEVARQVNVATRDLVGSSLVAVDAEDVEGKLRALPTVAGVSVDRAFPHTLVVKVAPERPVAVVRRGKSSWLVTGAGKVIRPIETGTQRAFPRLWLAKGTSIRLGGSVPAGWLPATRALAEAHSVGLGSRVKGIRPEGDELTLVLRRGTEIRLGRATEVGLKLTVAARGPRTRRLGNELRRRQCSAASSRRLSNLQVST